jgi:hypothetical protein
MIKVFGRSFVTYSRAGAYAMLLLLTVGDYKLRSWKCPPAAASHPYHISRESLICPEIRSRRYTKTHTLARTCAHTHGMVVILCPVKKESRLMKVRSCSRQSAVNSVRGRQSLK